MNEKKPGCNRGHGSVHMDYNLDAKGRCFFYLTRKNGKCWCRPRKRRR